MKTLIAATAIAVTTALAVPAAAEEVEEHIDLLSGYLELSERFINLAGRKEAAVFFAVEGVVEIHEERGEQAKAIPILQGFLEKYPEDQAVRNIIRYKLRDLYAETGQADLALEELATVIEENR